MAHVHSRWTALALLCLAQFMLIIDITAVNLALPTMAHDLDLGRQALTWVPAAYTLCFGGLLLLGGRLADGLGRRRAFLLGLAAFTLASLLSGVSQSGGELIAGRAAQGVAAALLSPAALSIVTTTFDGPERTKALSVWGAIGGAGAAVGVLVGGALTSGPGWRWVFFVNLPIGLAAARRSAWRWPRCSPPGASGWRPAGSAASIGRSPPLLASPRWPPPGHRGRCRSAGPIRRRGRRSGTEPGGPMRPRRGAAGFIDPAAPAAQAIP